MRLVANTSGGMRLRLVFVACLAGLTPASGAGLADALAASKGRTLDLVELGTGRRFVRPTLLDFVQRDDTVESLRIRPENESQIVTLRLAAIARIVIGRDTVHEAEVKGTGVAQLKAKRAKAAYDERRAASVARMRKNGVRAWPVLTAEQHAAAVEELEAFIERVREVFPKLVVSETHEFLVASDIPAEQMGPYVAGLDQMHDLLCDLYGIPRGEPVWQGKCLVVAFLSEADFLAFEARFMGNAVQGAHGLCHQREDGMVLTACHRGDDAPAFAHMLVHETSHGFNHRWMSPARLPNWLNEGTAEWIGRRVVPNSNQVPLKEAAALQFMTAGRTVGPGFLDAANIDAIQYGIASGIVRFLIDTDPRKFADFVMSIKEGTAAEKALTTAYGVTIDELLAAYGRTIGIPDLRR